MPYEDLDYEVEHYCLVYEEVITADLCYASLMCLSQCFKNKSPKE